MLNLAKPPRRLHTETSGAHEEKKRRETLDWKHYSQYIIFIRHHVQAHYMCLWLVELWSDILLHLKESRCSFQLQLLLCTVDILKRCIIWDQVQNELWHSLQSFLWKNLNWLKCTGVNLILFRQIFIVSETSSPALDWCWTKQGLRNTFPAVNPWNYTKWFTNGCLNVCNCNI